MVQTQTQIASAADAQRSGGGRKGLRNAWRKWKDTLTKDKSPPSRISTPIPTPAQAPAPPASHNPLVTATAASPPTSHILPTPEGVALFKPTTQTYIHSPLDKRNKSSTSSSPASTLRRRTYLGPRRNTAPADYFSLITDNSAAAAGTEEKAGNEVDNKKARRSSKLMMLSFSSKRGSMVPSQQQIASSSSSAYSMAIPAAAVSPAPSAPSPTGHENRRQTFQWTTAAEQIAALATQKSNETDLLATGVVEVIK